ncbi:7 transmembrane receptor (Secretin) [Mactra antiquata]
MESKHVELIEQVVCQSTARCGNIDCVGEAFGCKRKGNETICNCAIGLKGDACELDVNECLAYRPPCGNRGYCINTVGTFICSCVRGWRGLTCASLTHSALDFDCLPGYTGIFCFDDINECSSGATSCPGIHSNCVNTDGSYYCICNNGWEGTDCKDDIDECMFDTCSENEVCQNTPGSFSCICMTGWYGQHCDQNINECLTKPCGQFGNCIDTNGSFVCECSSGYIGDLCEINTEGKYEYIRL